MSNRLLTSQIGQRIFLPGHFDGPVVLEDARPLGSDDSAGYECRVRLPGGSLNEAVISAEEVAAVLGKGPGEAKPETPVGAEKLRLLIESTRIRLAYAHDQQFAVSLSGIRTLPHQIEAVYQAMLPQPRLRFLLANDPGAGKTIMAGLLVKELKLREAIERILILCPAPLTIQWQDEMLRWFGEPFDIIFSAVDQQQSWGSTSAPTGSPMKPPVRSSSRGSRSRDACGDSRSGSPRTNGTRPNNWPRPTGSTWSGAPWAIRPSLYVSTIPWRSWTTQSGRL